jgi:hypothetical protein
MGASGIADLDFGAAPGSNQTTLAITGQAAIVPGSLVEAWVHPTVDTADHTIDEQIIMDNSGLKAVAADIVNGVGFTIYLTFTPIMQDPTYPIIEGPGVGRTTYGVYKVAWVWA